MAWIPPSEQRIPENVYLDAAHNVYVETALGTGLIGALLFALSMAGGIRAYAARAAGRNSAFGAYGFSVLVFLASNMMLEALSFQPFLPLLICPVLLTKIGFVGEPAVVDERQVPAGTREVAYA